ncbi:hypothetical protein [Streptomyces sp. S.PB5]|uniref:hypothetical protein n=1 Tax=Streptomyces sp. S.PB5 TaxID=3020844 RepID=UPI0025AFD2CD|nr:hypothetical protein [Streptomyces sp. S.PB5]MDN3024938.1 hypothetical protein [Streptomyces sp. S.PB5]
MRALAASVGLRGALGRYREDGVRGLKAPDIVVEPAVREVAAVLVRPGPRVSVWGAWRVVVSVGGQGDTGDGSVVVLGLDEGPSMRVHAAEPLVVRQGGDG